MFPGFSGNPLDGADLALLYVKRPVNKTLPRLPQSNGFLGDGQRLVGLGWGVTGPYSTTPLLKRSRLSLLLEINDEFSNTLQVADRFQFMSHKNCANVWENANNVSATIDKRIICVWAKPVNQRRVVISICDGDEGGPLLELDTSSFDYESRFTFSGDPEKDIVYGIASFGPPQCGEEAFSVYTNIVEYLDWINETIAHYIPPPPLPAPNKPSSPAQVSRRIAGHVFSSGWSRETQTTV